MRIIAFVGSPVEDNEKDVSLGQIYNMIQNFRENIVFLLNTFNNYFFCHCLCPNPLLLQLVKLAKRLKKEKVNVDIINFGEEVSFQAYLPSYWCKAM